MSGEHKAANLVTEAVAKEIRKIPERRLDVDWFGIDPQGYVAFFVANDHGAIPRVADTARVVEALEAQLRVAQMRRATSTAGEGYRGSADRAQEPVFDPPRGPSDVPLHEARFEDYPHLVVTSDAIALRPFMDEWGATEALARDAFAAIFPVIGAMSLDEIHEQGICLGCRVLDLVEDPRPRAPEALAAAGLPLPARGASLDTSTTAPTTPTSASRARAFRPTSAIWSRSSRRSRSSSRSRCRSSTRRRWA